MCVCACVCVCTAPLELLWASLWLRLKCCLVAVMYGVFVCWWQTMFLFAVDTLMMFFKMDNEMVRARNQTADFRRGAAKPDPMCAVFVTDGTAVHHMERLSFYQRRFLQEGSASVRQGNPNDLKLRLTSEKYCDSMGVLTKPLWWFGLRSKPLSDVNFRPNPLRVSDFKSTS